MNRIFIGYDQRESVAYHVLSHSILKRTTQPVSITPLIRSAMPGYTRPRGEHDSTDFSNSRFMVPNLCDYQGWGLYLDSDMLCLDDITKVFDQANDRYDVMVKMVHHVPTNRTKFLGQAQVDYAFKNWSSFTLFNCERCQCLDDHIVNTAPGLWLHQFKWTNRVGPIRGTWNHLVGVHKPQRRQPSLLHFTNGAPCYLSYADSEYADLWRAELRDLMYGSNPEPAHELLEKDHGQNVRLQSA